MELVKYNGNLKSELFRFTTECFAELGKSFEPNGRHSFYNEIDNYFERFWCLVDEDKVKGTVAIARLDDITVELKALYLDSPLRGLGWGYKLLDEAVSFARENGFSRVVLDSMSHYKDAERLYRHYGFTDIDRYNDNVHLIVNSKYQGRGYGRQILLWALENINSKRIILRVAAWNKRAISLYEKNGFEIVGKA